MSKWLRNNRCTGRTDGRTDGQATSRGASDEGLKNSDALKISNDYSTSYGSNAFQAEGKAKFYSGSDELEDLPEEDREGQSIF